MAFNKLIELASLLSIYWLCLLPHAHVYSEAHATRRRDCLECDVAEMKEDVEQLQMRVAELERQVKRCDIDASKERSNRESQETTVDVETYEGKKILLIAGRGTDQNLLNTVDYYHPHRNVSFLNPPSTGGLILERQAHVAAIIKGEVHVAGGNRKEPLYLDSVEKLGNHSDRWTYAATMNERRNSLAGTAVGDKFFVCGGWGGHSRGRLASCEYLDPTTGLWSIVDVKPMRISRSNSIAVELSGQLYVIGGRTSVGASNSVERYNPQKNEWAFVAPLIQPRESASVAIVRGQSLLVCGGWDGKQVLAACEAYDPETDEWYKVADMLDARTQFAMVVFESRVVAMGGWNHENVLLKTVEIYDEDFNEWKRGLDLPEHRENFAAVVM